MNPGVTMPPRASTRRVAGPAKRSISAAVPTAAMRSPRTATASAQGCRRSPVHTRAPVTIRVAGTSAAAEPGEAGEGDEAGEDVEAGDPGDPGEDRPAAGRPGSAPATKATRTAAATTVAAGSAPAGRRGLASDAFIGPPRGAGSGPSSHVICRGGKAGRRADGPSCPGTRQSRRTWPHAEPLRAYDMHRG